MGMHILILCFLVRFMRGINEYLYIIWRLPEIEKIIMKEILHVFFCISINGPTIVRFIISLYATRFDLRF